MAPEAGSFVAIYKQNKTVIDPRSARQVGQDYQEKNFAGYRPKETESDVQDGVSEDIDFGDGMSSIELPSKYMHHHSMSKITIDASKSRAAFMKYM